MEVQREPPAHVKRQLRQEAGFGCCVCGYPFYEYHHIREFALDSHHDPKDMMVLCPNHHHQATLRVLAYANPLTYQVDMMRGGVGSHLYS
jgi:5-methylcytosine-specific restriction endonuclease McrA